MPEIKTSYIQHMVIKELAMGYPELLNGDSSNAEGLYDSLKMSLKKVTDNLKTIYPNELSGADPQMLEDARSNICRMLETICENINSSIEQMGKEQFLEHITSVRTEPVLHSNKLNIAGMPSKIVNIDDKMVPSIIRTGKCPQNGVWTNDRIHIAALAILVEEEYGDPVEYGLVEYAAIGIVRKVRIKTNDRRQVLKIKGRIESIINGKMPEKKDINFCKICNFSQMCNTKSSLASRFF